MRAALQCAVPCTAACVCQRACCVRCACACRSRRRPCPRWPSSRPRASSGPLASQACPWPRSPSCWSGWMQVGCGRQWAPSSGTLRGPRNARAVKDHAHKRAAVPPTTTTALCKRRPRRCGAVLVPLHPGRQQPAVQGALLPDQGPGPHLGIAIGHGPAHAPGAPPAAGWQGSGTFCLPAPLVQQHAARCSCSQGPPAWHPAPDALKSVCAAAASHAHARGVDIAKLALAHALRSVACVRCRVALVPLFTPGVCLRQHTAWPLSGPPPWTMAPACTPLRPRAGDVASTLVGMATCSLVDANVANARQVGGERHSAALECVHGS